MWSQTYRKHVIMALPSFDTATRQWRVQADISWCLGKRRHSTFIRYTRHQPTEAEAVHSAVQQSIEWIDKRLTFER
jgi:hypothetical protein